MVVLILARVAPRLVTGTVCVYVLAVALAMQDHTTALLPQDMTWEMQMVLAMVVSLQCAGGGHPLRWMMLLIVAA